MRPSDVSTCDVFFRSENQEGCHNRTDPCQGGRYQGERELGRYVVHQIGAARQRRENGGIRYGEHWSPNMEPPTTAPKQTMTYIGSVDIDQASGIARGNMTAKVPKEVPIEKETAMQMKSKRAGSRTGTIQRPLRSTM